MGQSKLLRSPLLVVALLLPITTTFANGFPTATPESQGVSSERLERFSAAMQSYIDNNLLAGTVSLISRNGKVIHAESQGWRDKDSGQAMTDDSIFFIMSMTKPIVSTALMMLYEEGHFLLTDPISKWIPELEAKQVIVQDQYGTHRVPPKRPITVRHVLSHTAGLDPAPEHLTEEEISRIERMDNLEDTLVNRATLPLAFHPGDEWQYGSSTDYVALLVERISGEPLKDFLQRRIFDPLQMEDTFYVVPPEKRNRVATVYSPTGPDQTIEFSRGPEYSDQPFFGSDYYGGTAGLFSTISDYWRFSQMILNGGELDGVRLLSPKTVNLMITNHTGDKYITVRGPGFNFGLGYGILADAGTAREPLTPGSFTWGGAWGTIFWADPVENMIGIMMTQITSYRHLNVRQETAVTAMQAIIDSYSNKPYSVKGYEVIK
ncbi:MAG: beta-lactamase family protein [Pseudomonadales bacterium]|nr:beta-lactamase family protein [Pseudomonadales bacterium]